MPRLIETTSLTKVRIELELTPKWWSQLTRRLSAHSNYNDARVLHAQVVGLAMSIDGVFSVTTESQRLLVLALVPRDVTGEQLAQKAEQVREAMHQLDTSCLRCD